MPYLNQKSIDALKNLHSYNCPPDNYQTPKRSAVLVALVPNEQGDLEVILTSRATSLRTNAGDSAFPGGKMDPEDDDLLATAKREAMEEVALPPSSSSFITYFPPVLSRHMQVVTPVVAFCPHLTTANLFNLLVANPSEVSAIFTAPLETFLSPQPEHHEYFDMSWLIAEYRIHRFEKCGTHNYLLTPLSVTSPTATTSSTHPAQANEHSSTPKPDSHSSDSDDKEVEPDVDRSKVGWPVYGMTAGILIEVACVAFQRAPSFSAYAPEQVTNQEKIADWYNQSQHAFRRSSL